MSLGSPSHALEKHGDVVKDLLEDILRKRGSDPTSNEIIMRLQGLCRLFEAMLRTERRQKLAAKMEEKKNYVHSSLPVAAQAALRFSLRSFLNLYKMVSVSQPQMFRMIIDEAANILDNLPPLSLATDDPSVVSSIDEVSRFFESVLRG